MNPLERKRSDFSEDSQPVRIAGADWYLRRPRVRNVPCDNLIGFETTIGGPMDDEYRSALQAYDKAISAEKPSGMAVLEAELRLASALIRSQYTLTLEEVADLIAFPTDGTDTEGRSLRDAVLGIVFGTNAPRDAASHRRCSLLANRIDPQGLGLDEMISIVDMLVATGRTIPLDDYLADQK